MTPRSVRPLSADALNALTTARLLAYRSRLLELEDSADLTDEERASLDPALVYFKNEANWVQLHALVRSVLATREHVS